MISAIAAVVIAFLMLRKSDTFKRHLLALLAAAGLTGMAAIAVFEINHPYPGYASGPRLEATIAALGMWLVCLAIGFSLGAVAARFVRRRSAVSSAPT
jgi:predicted PurR-regulated permease PerM